MYIQYRSHLSSNYCLFISKYILIIIPYMSAYIEQVWRFSTCVYSRLQIDDYFFWVSKSFFPLSHTDTEKCKIRVTLGIFQSWDIDVPWCKMSSQKLKMCHSLVGSSCFELSGAYIPSKHSSDHTFLWSTLYIKWNKMACSAFDVL